MLNKVLISFILLTFIFSTCKSETETKTEKGLQIESNAKGKSQRDGKVFSLFSIVSFPNDGCVTQSGTTTYTARNRNGTCYTSTECASLSGTASGNCASGFGVCCLFTYSTSGTTIKQNCSYLQNPGFPSVYTSTTALSYKISKLQSDVCYIRLDFEAFVLLGPTATSDTTACVDSFIATVSPSGYTTSKICGTNTGEHIYLSLGPSSTASATLAFTFGTTSTTRTFEIKVTQIECWSRARPYDPGCLQYYTGTQGRISSFNFQYTSTFAHLDSQNQNICIRQEEGNCCIRYNLCSDTNSWAISYNTGTIAIATSSGSLCALDYVNISGVTETCDQAHNQPLFNKICGYAFGLGHNLPLAQASAHVCDCTAPFQVQFISNSYAAETTPSANNVLPQRGFCFEYQQVGCT